MTPQEQLTAAIAARPNWQYDSINRCVSIYGKNLNVSVQYSSTRGKFVAIKREWPGPEDLCLTKTASEALDLVELHLANARLDRVKLMSPDDPNWEQALREALREGTVVSGWNDVAVFENGAIVRCCEDDDQVAPVYTDKGCFILTGLKIIALPTNPQQ